VRSLASRITLLAVTALFVVSLVVSAAFAAPPAVSPSNSEYNSGTGNDTSTSEVPGDPGNSGGNNQAGDV